MTVYVDDMRLWAQVGRVSGNWSHLFATSTEELEAFARRMGLNPKWAQDKPPGFHHYDLVETRRLQAIRLGAVPCSWRDTPRLAGMERRHRP